jgi:hypothetical protein
MVSRFAAGFTPAASEIAAKQPQAGMRIEGDVARIGLVNAALTGSGAQWASRRLRSD